MKFMIMVAIVEDGLRENIRELSKYDGNILYLNWRINKYKYTNFFFKIDQMVHLPDVSPYNKVYPTSPQKLWKVHGNNYDTHR